jgi:hypothetical protein
VGRRDPVGLVPRVGFPYFDDPDLIGFVDETKRSD